MPRRFLLDQSFPTPPFDVSVVEAGVEFVPLHAFDAELAQTSTPDWLLILHAAAAGFDGVVLGSGSALDQDEPRAAAALTGLSLVRWAHAVDDPVRQWGLLLAYIPLVIKRIESGGPAIFSLPSPVLRVHHLSPAGAGADAGAAAAAVFDAARRFMLDELALRHLPDLAARLETQ